MILLAFWSLSFTQKKRKKSHFGNREFRLLHSLVKSEPKLQFHIQFSLSSHQFIYDTGWETSTGKQAFTLFALRLFLPSFYLLLLSSQMLFGPFPPALYQDSGGGWVWEMSVKSCCYLTTRSLRVADAKHPFSYQAYSWLFHRPRSDLLMIQFPQTNKAITTWTLATVYL